MSLENIESIENNTEFKLIAQGNTAEVYLYDNNKILKLFRENLPTEPIVAEYEKVKSIQLKLHNVPKVYEIIRYRGRYGIIYEKVIGTDMINNMLKNIFNLKSCSFSLSETHSVNLAAATGRSHCSKSPSEIPLRCLYSPI